MKTLNRNLINSLLGAASLSLIGCGSLRTAVHTEWSKTSEQRVAVMPFNGESPFTEELADALVTELIDANFAVMERSGLNKIMKEQELQYTGAIDPLAVARSGRLAGVEYIVIGSVTTRRVVPALEWLIGEGRSQDQIDTVRVRWVSVQTGQVVASMSVRNSHGGSVTRVARQIAKSLSEGAKTASRRALALEFASAK